jgi:HSP20 family protein
MSLLKKTNWPHLSGSLLSDFLDDDKFMNSPWLRGQSLPAINVKETDKQIEVELAAPGFKKDDLSISLDEGVLTISGEREDQKENNNKNEQYTRREFSYSSFTRSFHLPKNVTEQDINASFEDGVLNIVIKKSEQRNEQTKRAIQIQ